MGQLNVIFLCLMYSVATQLAFSVGPPSTRQRNAIRMAFRWRADGGPLLDVYWEIYSISTYSYAKCVCTCLLKISGTNYLKKKTSEPGIHFSKVSHTLTRKKLFASSSVYKFFNFMLLFGSRIKKSSKTFNSFVFEANSSHMP